MRKNINLGVFLAIGESFSDFSKKGQDSLIKEYLLGNYSKNFNRVYVFSYDDEEMTFFGNVFVIPNRWRIHRYLYALFLPLIHFRVMLQCNVLRGLQLSGGIPGIVAKLLFGKKIVINYGYNYVQFAKVEKKYVQAVGFSLITFPILLSVDGVIVTAAYLRNTLSKMLQKKCILIPNGVDVSLFRLLRVHKRYDIVAVGRLERQKNFKTLIQAIAITRKKLKLLIIGTGTEEQVLRLCAKKNTVCVDFVSKIPHNELPNLLNAAKIFVLPSYIEGHPKVLLEAMSCGLPVIASNIPAHRSIVSSGANGILTTTKTKDLARAILLLVTNKKLAATLGRAARQKIESDYNIKNLQKKEIQVLLSKI